MQALLPLYLDQIILFVLILTRVAGLVAIAPFFGARGAPMRVRGMLAVAMALLLLPLHLPTPLDTPPHLLGLVSLLAKEMMLGLALGLAVMIVTGGIQIAGQLLSQVSGLSLAEVFDPNFETNVPIISQFMDWVALGAFFCIGGHRFVLRALLDSFRWQPPGGGHLPAGLSEALTEITARSFSAGIRIAAPCLAALLLAVLVTGVVSRALPQLNVFAVGFNLNIVVLLAVLATSLGSASWIYQDEIVIAVELVQQAWQTDPSEIPRDSGHG